MLTTLASIFAAVLGFKPGATVGNAATGIVNYGLMTTVGLYAWNHKDDLLTFQVSVGTLCLAVGVVLLVAEIGRRTSPGAGG